MMEITKQDGLILVNDMLFRIAELLVPMPDLEPTLIELQKRFTISEKNYRYELLTDLDVDLLFRIFQKSDLDFDSLMSGVCTKEQYQPFKVAFESSALKPEWDILPYYRNHKDEAKIRRMTVHREHYDQIKAAANTGEISMLSNNHGLTVDVRYDTIIKHDDAEAYLMKRGLTLTEPTNQGVTKTRSEPKRDTKINVSEKVRDTITAFIDAIVDRDPKFDPMNAPNRIEFYATINAWAKQQKGKYILNSSNQIKNHAKDLIQFGIGGRPTNEHSSYYSSLFT